MKDSAQTALIQLDIITKHKNVILNVNKIQSTKMESVNASKNFIQSIINAKSAQKALNLMNSFKTVYQSVKKIKFLRKINAFVKMIFIELEDYAQNVLE